ncbi:hypothetical protein BaRGS_00026163, partial [Batillaria attramentaria]
IEDPPMAVGTFRLKDRLQWHATAFPPTLVGNFVSRALCLSSRRNPRLYWWLILGASLVNR